MKKVIWIKILLDVAMAVAFALLFNTGVIAGLAFHEAAGLAIGLAFVVHLVINQKWIRTVTRNLFSKKVPVETKIGYFVDALLLLSMAYIIISGVFMSRIIFPNLSVGSELFFKNTHIAAAYISLAFLGVHIGLHWQWVMGIFRKIFRIKKQIKVLGYLAKAVVILVFAAGVYCMDTVDYFPRVAAIGISYSQNHGQKTNARFEKTLVPAGGDVDLSQGSGGLPGQGGFQRGAGRNTDTGILNTRLVNLGILSVFSILTYYVKKLLIRISKRRSFEKKAVQNQE